MAVSFITPFNATTAYALDIPQPIYPSDFSFTTPITDPPLGVPSFTWLVVTGATKYRLQVDSEIGFKTPIMNITTANTSYTPAVDTYLFADGELYWRVRVESPTPVGEWSEIMHFTKTWATNDNKPTLIAPENYQILAFFNAPDFSWTPVIGAAKYRIKIATSQDGFNNPIFSEDTLTHAFQPTSRLGNGEYWWRVIPIDIAGHIGTSSEIRTFTMAYGTYAMDLVPILLAPANGSLPTFTPTFHWTAVIGAEKYDLQYSTDCTFSTNVINKETSQTYYTPIETFPNEINYCWRVRVKSGPAEGDWSESWSFTKQWTLEPQLLTPTNLYRYGLYPFYSWTPVPGASYYKIEISDKDGIFETATTANTSYTPRSKYLGTDYYYWQVTPFDGSGEAGSPSVEWSYQSYYTSTAPILVYPLYYYLPNDPNYYVEHIMNPVEDRTVTYPIFIWHRVMIPAPYGGVYADAYRIQVDTTDGFNNIVWEYDTENTSASPINGSGDFSPQVGQDYFWRVCVLDYIGGNCRLGQYFGWSQIWKARFDPGLALPPTNGAAPEPLRPTVGQESVEATPLLEWWPLQDATQYQVEIDRDSNFSTVEISNTATVNIPAYAP
jgi:hypothetical protein